MKYLNALLLLGMASADTELSVGSHGPDPTDEDGLWNNWNYKKNGADWGDEKFTSAWIAGENGIENMCGGSNQSPINLFTRENENFEGYEEMKKSENNDQSQGIINGLHDSFSANYFDLNNKYFKWNGHAASLDMSEVETPMSFDSSIGSEHFGGARTWYADNLHIHTPSEHTVNGQ